MAKNELNIQPRPNNRIVVMEHIPNRHQSRAVRIIRIKTFIKSHNDSMWWKNHAKFFRCKSKKIDEEKNSWNEARAVCKWILLKLKSIEFYLKVSIFFFFASINMKGLVHHTPADEDISNILKEFTVDFLLKGYGHLMQELHEKLLSDSDLVIEIFYNRWIERVF